MAKTPMERAVDHLARARRELLRASDLLTGDDRQPVAGLVGSLDQVSSRLARTAADQRRDAVRRSLRG